MPRGYTPRKLTVEGDQREFEVTLRFRIRRGGHPGNDAGMFARSYGLLLKVLPLFDHVQWGDENVEIASIRWRRPKQKWQEWEDPYA